VVGDMYKMKHYYYSSLCLLICGCFRCAQYLYSSIIYAVKLLQKQLVSVTASWLYCYKKLKCQKIH